jgi:hypothetical protein
LERGRKPRIQHVAAKPQRRGRQALQADRRAGKVPGHFPMPQGVGEHRAQPKARNRGRSQAGDKFAADAVTRITAGFGQRHRDAFAAQRDAQGEPGQSAPDDFNGPQAHGRRMATMR